MQRLLLHNFDRWPERADIRFRFGTFVGASTAPWPHGFRELYLFGAMDEAEVAIWRSVLRTGDTVIDGGANWGYYSLLAASLIGSCGRVVAVEPSPGTADALDANIAASGYRNIEVVRKALADCRREAILHFAANDPFAGRTSLAEYDGEQWVGTAPCSTTTIDSLVQSCGITPTVVKLDIEGCELAALRGARATLRATEPPAVTFEWNARTASGVGVHPSDALALIRDLGYDAFIPTGTGLRPFTPRDDVDWSPMVWCFRRGIVHDRARAAGAFARA